MDTSDIKDCVVIGGGPAGLTAALYLARFLRSVTVFDGQDGRARMIPRTHNLTPFPDGIPGQELLDRMQSHARRYGAVIQTGTVEAVERQGNAFQVRTDRQAVLARNVIFATGVFNHRPPLSARDHALGLARGLLRYCPVCDAYEVRDKRIAVLGSGTHGLKEASFLRHYSPSVTLVSPDGAPGTARNGIRVLQAALTGIALSETEILMTLQDGETRPFDTMYVALGTTPRTDPAGCLGVELDEDGHIAIDAKQKTNLDGVYAIGDVTNGIDQIAVAMGQGAVAATAIHNDLSASRS
ncbi:NAD(P)/FAD-dependent oxidoreductase [Paracoccus liaowanqingii]|uniref:NAD(P)/FAD-dependent oxidoreductase n=1 Tax=Paracoccus liaowanqingii TaxID=2560053 RepID=UPI001E31759A|nr:NAD(P)/FAD-dependent oxidoreductase [Paracoccus liaowanqingii]